jgi:hypothetical protein
MTDFQSALPQMAARASMAALSSPPIWIRSGFSRSLIALPSARNSWLEHVEGLDRRTGRQDRLDGFGCAHRQAALFDNDRVALGAGHGRFKVWLQSCTGRAASIPGLKACGDSQSRPSETVASARQRAIAGGSGNWPQGTGVLLATYRRA